MIVYEVTCSVPRELAKTFEDYMVERHIPQVIATGCFESATFEHSSTGSYRTRYIAQTQEALDRYFEQCAHALRDDFGKHMPAVKDVVRQEWTVVKRFA